MAAMFTVYGMSDSGNCYKVRLALAQLRLPYRWVEVDSRKGETRTAAFLARNPNTIADISLYAYTHCAADGGFDLGRYPAIRAWLSRVAAEPRFVPRLG